MPVVLPALVSRLEKPFEVESIEQVFSGPQQSGREPVGPRVVSQNTPGLCIHLPDWGCPLASIESGGGLDLLLQPLRTCPSVIWLALHQPCPMVLLPSCRDELEVLWSP